MKRDEAIHELRAGRKELQETLIGFTEEDFLRAKAIDKWTLKDLIAHVASWDEEMVRVLQQFSMQDERANGHLYHFRTQRLCGMERRTSSDAPRAYRQRNHGRV